jgi:hypothetical protein
MLQMTQTDEVLVELRKMNKFLALIAMDGKGQPDKIEILDKLDFGPKEIAELIGITPNAVSVALHSIRKSKGKKKK